MRKQRQQRLRDVELKKRAHSAESDSGHGQTAGEERSDCASGCKYQDNRWTGWAVGHRL